MNTAVGYFEKLHADSWDLLYLIACKKLGDRQEAYDLLQDFFLELWEKRTIFPLDQLSEAWLKKRLWFKLLSHFRTNGFRQQHMENYRHFVLQQGTTDLYGISEGWDEEHFEMIMNAIELSVAQLPARMQEIFILNKEQHFSINEIAQRLQLSPNTVRNHLHAAMKKLRMSLDDQQLSTTGLGVLWWVITQFS